MTALFARRIWTLCTLWAIASGLAWGQPEMPVPDPAAPLHERITAWDALLHEYHYHDNIVQTQVIFPPFGEDRPITGNHEDVAGHTAALLAAYSHRYAVTREPAHRAAADDLMQGILNLERVTGVPGCVARSFYQTDRPLWHEQAYFFPNEWHDSKTMPGYRWEGDLSSDKFTDFFFAVGTYWEICADEEHKQLAADFLDRFVGRCVDFNFKLVDVDGKMTLWGNFCPDLPHENLNALEMLAGLRTAYKVTGKDRYLAAYHMLIDRYHYDDQAILAKVLWPKEWTVPWDDSLAAQSYYMLMRFEDDPSLMQKYRMSINRHYFAWKDYKFGYASVPFYFMLYQVLTGEEAVDGSVLDAIKNMRGGHRTLRTFTKNTPDGPQQVQSYEEEVSADTILNYWFGRHYGFIDPAW
ncbi:MAG TPA: hypothetical protein PLJ71_15905 [Candidatus Hydrogenedentes bacterium]|nr:hypothetical protein [Candidatus Hydrogenedentota bacterium]